MTIHPCNVQIDSFGKLYSCIICVCFSFNGIVMNFVMYISRVMCLCIQNLCLVPGWRAQVRRDSIGNRCSRRYRPNCCKLTYISITKIPIKLDNLPFLVIFCLILYWPFSVIIKFAFSLLLYYCTYQ
jgi:hypothetical protein